MRGRGSLTQVITAALVAVLLTSSLGTAWTVRSSLHSNVDPSLRAGELALVHTTAGLAGALSLNLMRLGATDVQTESAADTVIARLSGDALAAIAHDPTVTVAARDIQIVALDGPSGRSGWDNERGSEKPAGPRTDPSPARARGERVAVAVMDTGVGEHPDLSRGKVRARANFVQDGNNALDAGGHGTFIAGVIAADGEYQGVAPDATIVSLRVLDANGTGTAAGVVRAFNWLLMHRATYDIKVLNISWGAPQATSYDNDLLSALAESAWFAGITVVASAGNSGPSGHTISTPASDPFIVTVGAYDDMGTTRTSDDAATTFSGHGPTLDGFAKPDTLAPGVHILGLRARGVTYLGADGQPVGSPTDRYIHMTGTSASAAYVSGVAALLASAHPTYTPTQIKGAIFASGRAVAGSPTKAVDAASALTVQPAVVNVGLRPSALLLAVLSQMHMLRVHGVSWEGVTWDGITWESVSWETVSWENVTWQTVTWDSVTWERLLQ